MRLGVISDSLHSYDQAGRLYNHTEILVRQLQCWAELFDEVIVCAPLTAGPPPPTAAVYDATNIDLLPIRPGGGNRILDKLKLLGLIPAWWSALSRLLTRVDAVHIRCPSNIGIVGLAALHHAPHPRQALFTGMWTGYKGEPLTYRWQRWYLEHAFRGPVAVYGDWKNRRSHIVPSFSPTYYEADWDREEAHVEQRLARLRGVASVPEPVCLATVGSLTQNKDQETVIRAVQILKRQGLLVRLHVIGGGPEYARLRALTERLALSKSVVFDGRIPHEQVRERYRAADFVVQAPRAEGFGKVPVESFFHGAVPLLTDVGVSRQLVGDGSRGRCFRPGDSEAVADSIQQLLAEPREVSQMIVRGRDFARQLTMEAWKEHLRQMVAPWWDTDGDAA